MIITDLNCLEVISGSDDVVGGFDVVVIQSNSNRTSQSSTNTVTNSGGANAGRNQFVGNSNFTGQFNGIEAFVTF